MRSASPAKIFSKVSNFDRMPLKRGWLIGGGEYPAIEGGRRGICAGSFCEARMAGELELLDDPLQFVLRIWLEEGNGASFWRGSVQEIDGGVVSHFQDGPALLRS
jgi:hypothetical protein